jgi:2-oxoglutarate/2-oxoacid ferredoxin oxidoreductase subunit alpha
LAEKYLMKGNEALAEAAIRAGIDGYFGYPITPQSEVLEYFSKWLPRKGIAYVQAESEVSAINMVYGAGACGKRVMTSTSSRRDILLCRKACLTLPVRRYRACL